ncbi:hypothetical protein chiPu_0011334 [Chiloscyllium punctatum]|uniref:Uncharacterized protein n=1 Tax=Chiloscyllium punctatum TaxID=137246 RepID=A0A401SR44_CHIPU|nr:hypothetical protein [Chiloscyllium punctatum]
MKNQIKPDFKQTGQSLSSRTAPFNTINPTSEISSAPWEIGSLLRHSILGYRKPSQRAAPWDIGSLLSVQHPGISEVSSGTASQDIDSPISEPSSARSILGYRPSEIGVLLSAQYPGILAVLWPKVREEWQCCWRYRR